MIEIVQINEQQCAAEFFPPRGDDGVIEAVDQQAPVGKPSQGIVKRQLINLLFRRLALRDVPQYRDEIADLFAVLCYQNKNENNTEKDTKIAVFDEFSRYMF